MKRMAGIGMILLIAAAISVGLYMTLTRDASPAAEGSSAALGLMLLEKENGLYVLAVTQGSPADRSGVQPGDYLVAAGEARLNSMERLDDLLGGGAEAIPLTLHREGREMYIQLPMR